MPSNSMIDGVGGTRFRHCRHFHFTAPCSVPACLASVQYSMPRPRDIDIVVVFRASIPSIHISKQKARQEAQEAEDQYSRLLDLLRKSGLYAVGRRGEHQGQLIVLVSCSGHQLGLLLQRER